MHFHILLFSTFFPKWIQPISFSLHAIECTMHPMKFSILFFYFIYTLFFQKFFDFKSIGTVATKRNHVNRITDPKNVYALDGVQCFEFKREKNRERENCMTKSFCKQMRFGHFHNIEKYFANSLTLCIKWNGMDDADMQMLGMQSFSLSIKLCVCVRFNIETYRC